MQLLAVVFIVVNIDGTRCLPFLILRISQLPDGSLRISPADMNDSGVYTVLADNGLGQVARNQLTLKVYPSRMPIEVQFEYKK